MDTSPLPGGCPRVAERAATRPQRLSKSVVDRLAPRDKAYEVSDPHLTGFYIRVFTSGAKTAVIRYVSGRRQRRLALGRIGEGYTLAQARQDAKRQLRAIHGGSDPSSERHLRRQAATFGEVSVIYMKEHAELHLKPSTIRSYAGLLRNHILPRLGATPAEDVQHADVEALHRRIGKSARGAANRAIALVSAICTFAEKRGYRKGFTNPCRGLKRYREQGKERYLSSSERVRLESALTRCGRAAKGHPDYVCPTAITAIRLLSLTGARCGEIVGLRWNMVDLQRGLLRLPDSKTGSKTIPLSRQAISLLEAIRPPRAFGKAWVCPGERGGKLQNLRRAWSKIRRIAELDDLRLHDLRCRRSPGSAGFRRRDFDRGDPRGGRRLLGALAGAA